MSRLSNSSLDTKDVGEAKKVSDIKDKIFEGRVHNIVSIYVLFIYLFYGFITRVGSTQQQHMAIIVIK